MIKFPILFLVTLLLGGCSSDPKQQQEKVISVSIEPLRYLTRQITGNDFEINVLVPPGASPETYEPTPAQMRKMNESFAFVGIGLLDFEHNLSRAIQDNMPHIRQITLSENIDLIAGEHHAENHGEHARPGHTHAGNDPHIWTSPACLKQMAGTLYGKIAELYPDSASYKANYERFLQKMDSLDRELKALFSGRTVSFMIYHPSLSYFAREYGIRQIPIEYEGKEPSADYMRRLVDTARKLHIGTLFYQNQFSRSTVEALSRELDIEAVPIDPLATDVENNLMEMAKSIANP